MFSQSGLSTTNTAYTQSRLSTRWPVSHTILTKSWFHFKISNRLHFSNIWRVLSSRSPLALVLLKAYSDHFSRYCIIQRKRSCPKCLLLLKSCFWLQNIIWTPWSQEDKKDARPNIVWRVIPTILFLESPFKPNLEEMKWQLYPKIRSTPSATQLTAK